MKVCLIYEFLSEQGGLERELINHSNFLKEAGYDVEILTCHFDKKILELLPFQGIKIRNISEIKTPWESVNLALCFLGFNKLNEINPDLFLSYSAPCNFLIRNKKTKKANYVNHFPHFLYLSSKEKLEWANSTQGVKRWLSVLISFISGSSLKTLDKKLLKQNGLIFMNSQFTKKRLDKLYGLKSTIVSYPPLDLRFMPSKTKINRKFIFSSSRIIPDKKYEWLIEAISYMKNQLPLYIAGSVEESYKKKLVSLAESRKVDIKFLGRLNTEKIRDYYSNAEIFAFPTPQEDFGLVPAESLACGTPCVVWGDGAGPTEQIINNVNGFHAKPYDLKDFAKKLDLCINSRIKYKNRKKIIKSAKKFSSQVLKQQFIKAIKKFIS